MAGRAVIRGHFNTSARPTEAQFAEFIDSAMFPEDDAVIFAGFGSPASTLGEPGNYYIDFQNNLRYGPKVSGNWGSGTAFGGMVTIANNLSTANPAAALGASQGTILDAADVQSISLSGTDLTITLKGGTTLTAADLTSLVTVMATSVSPAADDATGATGTSTEAAKADHKHPAQGVSSDAEQLLTIGADGLHLLDPDNLVSGAAFNLLVKNIDGKLYVAGIDTVTADGSAAGINYTGTAVDLTLLSTDPGQVLSKGSDGGVFLNTLGTEAVNDITERDALSGLNLNTMVFVVDASADPTITTGAALYLWNGTGYDKLTEFESLDLLAASSISPAADDTTGALGSSAAYAREDHKHPVQAPSNDPNNDIGTGLDGRHTFNLQDHAANTNPVTPDGSAAEVGTSERFAKEDHKHEAQDVSQVAGNDLTKESDGLHHFNLQDHVSSSDPAKPTSSTPDQGTSEEFARADHRHAAQDPSGDADNLIGTDANGLHKLTEGDLPIVSISGWQVDNTDAQNPNVAQPDTVTVDSSVLVAAPLNVQDVNINGNLLFGASAAAETGWTHGTNTNQFIYTGAATQVDIRIQKHHAIPGTANRQRPAPVMELYKDGALVASSATGYVRDTSDHEEAGNTILYTDIRSGASTTYTVLMRRDSTNTGQVDSINGQFSARAITRETVYKP